jgi:ketosteroid isomerase-like protein
MVQNLRDAFETWQQAWNSGDLEGYLAAYWDAAETRYTSNGAVIRGKVAIAEAYRARVPSPEMMGTLNVPELDIELMGERDALVFGVWQLAGQDGSISSGAFTVHVRHINGRWYILSDHTCG